jgi:hypothetical protein
VLLQGHQAKVLVADAENQAQEFYRQTLIPNGDSVTFLNEPTDLLNLLPETYSRSQLSLC